MQWAGRDKPLLYGKERLDDRWEEEDQLDAIVGMYEEIKNKPNQNTHAEP